MKTPYLLFLSSKNGYGVIESLTKKENMQFKHQKTIAYVDKNVDKKSPVMRPKLQLKISKSPVVVLQLCHMSEL